MRIGRCQFCGRLGVVVDRFPRRGYGRQHYGLHTAVLRQAVYEDPHVGE